MKYIFTLLLAVSSLQLFSQTPFEGTVRYIVESPGENKTLSLKIFFGTQGLRLEPADSITIKKDDEIIIIRFDSGKVFTLKPKQKAYRISELNKAEKISFSTVSTIAGHPVKQFSYESSGLPTVEYSYFGEPVVHVADDLYYPVPEEYVGNPQLLMIYKNRIVLDAEVPIQIRGNQGNHEKTTTDNKQPKNGIKATAFEVKAETFLPELFTIPSDYVFQDTRNYYPQDSTDSVRVLIDSAVRTPYEPTIKQKKKSPKKKKPTTKQNSIRRNDE